MIVGVMRHLPYCHEDRSDERVTDSIMQLQPILFIAERHVYRELQRISVPVLICSTKNSRADQGTEHEMIARKPVCAYCHNAFNPSPFHPKQSVCKSPECQRRRRSDSHRKRIATDSDYRQACIESRKKWRDNHPDYQRSYRSKHEAYVEQNRQKQHQRNQKRQLALIVKNNLAISQVMIFQTLGESAGQV